MCKLTCPSSRCLVLLGWKTFAEWTWRTQNQIKTLAKLDIKQNQITPIHCWLVPVLVSEEEISLRYQTSTFTRYVFHRLKLYQGLPNMKNNIFEEIYLTNSHLCMEKPQNRSFFVSTEILRYLISVHSPEKLIYFSVPKNTLLL